MLTASCLSWTLLIVAIRLMTAAIDAALEVQRRFAAEARATQRLVDELAQRQAQLRRGGNGFPRMGRCPSIGPGSSAPHLSRTYRAGTQG